MVTWVHVDNCWKDIITERICACHDKKQLALLNGQQKQTTCRKQRGNGHSKKPKLCIYI